MWLRLACGADGDVARRVGHDHQCCGRGIGNAHPGVSGYASSEAGLMRLTDTLAAELVRRGSSIRVLALMPGLMCSAVTEGVASLSAGRERLSAITDGLTAGQDGDAATMGRSVVALIVAASNALDGRILYHSDDPEVLGARLSAGGWSGPVPVPLCAGRRPASVPAAGRIGCGRHHETGMALVRAAESPRISEPPWPTFWWAPVSLV